MFSRLVSLLSISCLFCSPSDGRVLTLWKRWLIPGGLCVSLTSLSSLCVLAGGAEKIFILTFGTSTAAHYDPYPIVKCQQLETNLPSNLLLLINICAREICYVKDGLSDKKGTVCSFTQALLMLRRKEASFTACNQQTGEENSGWKAAKEGAAELVWTVGTSSKYDKKTIWTFWI